MRTTRIVRVPPNYLFAGWPSSLARSVATWMALAMVDRTLPSSMASRPAIVHPPGAGKGKASILWVNYMQDLHVLVTLSLICAGCAFGCSAILAAPCIAENRHSQYASTQDTLRETNVLCAANSNASALGNPIITPPSAIASRKIHANAGPLPLSAVHASKCFSSRKRQRPMEEKMVRIMRRSSSAVGEGG